MSGYKVVVTREGDNWLADVPEVEGTHTFARTLRQLDTNVREAIALALDLPDGAEADVRLVYETHVGDDSASAQLDRLRSLREGYEKAGRTLREQTPDLVLYLAQQGLAIRDISFLTGVSYQRVSQIKDEERAKV